MKIIDRYIALKDEYQEIINWSCGKRLGYMKDNYPDLHNYVCIWTPDDGLCHTLFGNNLEEIQIRCYNEFIDGERNNIKRFEYYPDKKFSDIFRK